MVDFAIDGLDEIRETVAFAIDGFGMTWQLHKKTRTKVRVFRAKKYLQKVLTFSTRKWPKKYLLMYDSPNITYKYNTRNGGLQNRRVRKRQL